MCSPSSRRSSRARRASSGRVAGDAGDLIAGPDGSAGPALLFRVVVVGPRRLGLLERVGLGHFGVTRQPRGPIRQRDRGLAALLERVGLGNVGGYVDGDVAVVLVVVERGEPFFE